MSTKSSCAYVEINVKSDVHIYREMLDDKYYIQFNDDKPIEFPEEWALILEKELKKKRVKGKGVLKNE